MKKILILFIFILILGCKSRNEANLQSNFTFTSLAKVLPNGIIEDINDPNDSDHLGNINAHSIVDGIRIFYSRKNIIFKKDDKELIVNLDKIMTGNNNVKYQYINFTFNDGNYYFIFFAKSWWKELPTAKGEWGMGNIKTVFTVKIKNSFDEYEINNQYLSQFVPQEYMITADMLKKNGTIFYWFIMGNIYEEENRSDIYKIISIDASKPEKGFIVNEYQNYELIHEYWTNIVGDEINSTNREFIFFDEE